MSLNKQRKMQNLQQQVNTKVIPQKINGVFQKLQIPIYKFSIYSYACLYMFTGVSKIKNMDSFSKGLHKVPYLEKYASLIGWGIPMLEIIIALMLIVPGLILRFALWISTLLMGIFVLFILWLKNYYPDKMCHCGKVLENMGWHTHLIFNLLWLGLGIYAIYYNKKFINKN